MEALAPFILLAVLVIAWFLIAKKLAAKHWVIRHLVGSVAGVFSFFVGFGLLLELGFIKPEHRKVEAEPKEQVAQLPVTELIANEQEDEEYFGAESQAILDDIKPRMSALVKSGIAMERLRHSDDLSDVAKCGDLMRNNQAELRLVRDDFHAALNALPENQGRWHLNFEPLFNAEANLIICVTCSLNALPDCQAAAEALRIE